MTKRIFEWVELVLGIDVRSLAFFRVLLGGIILYDLGLRFGSLKAHYTDEGILSRTVLEGISENPLLLSINMLDGGASWQLILFILAAFFALSFTIGYRTKISTVLLSVFILSIHVRNPFLNNLGDWFLLHLLLWSILLPLGAVFSIDSNLQKKGNPFSMTCLSVASMGIIFQILSLYFFSVYYKISPIWHTDASAVYYALSLDRIVTSVGEFVYSLPYDWLVILTRGTLILEKWGPLLLFIPFFTVSIRIAIILSFMLFHVGLFLALELGVFPIICIAAWVLFLPGQFWDFVFFRRTPINRETNNDLGEISSSNINWLESLVATFLLLIMLTSNMLHSGKMSEGFYEMGYKYVEPLANSLNLRQRWNMFSPHPSRQDGWFLVVGVKEDGTMINLANEGSRVDWRRPVDISATYKNQRWRKNYEWVMMRWDPHAQLLAEYMLDNWNSRNERVDHIDHVLVYFMTEYTQESYSSTPIERKILYRR